MNIFRKLGHMSFHFVFCKSISSGGEQCCEPQHFRHPRSGRRRSERSDVINNDVISIISQIEMHDFVENGEKNLDKGTASRNLSGRDCAWLTSEIKSKIRERDFYLRKAKRTGAELDWPTYRRTRNKVTLMIRKSKANHSRTLFRENIKSPKEFWKKIKQIYPKENNSANVKMFKIDQEPVIDKQKISNSFCSFFTNVASTLKGIVCDMGDKA